MIITDFFVWWYGHGWYSVLATSRRRLVNLAGLFSAKSLLRTLFAPWRRISTPPGSSPQAHLRAMGDNLVSRSIGFTVRLLVLIAAVVSLLFLAAVELIELVVWPLVPPAAIGLLIWGVI